MARPHLALWFGIVFLWGVFWHVTAFAADSGVDAGAWSDSLGSELDQLDSLIQKRASATDTLTETSAAPVIPPRVKKAAPVAPQATSVSVTQAAPAAKTTSAPASRAVTTPATGAAPAPVKPAPKPISVTATATKSAPAVKATPVPVTAKPAAPIAPPAAPKPAPVVPPAASKPAPVVPPAAPKPAAPIVPPAAPKPAPVVPPVAEKSVTPAPESSGYVPKVRDVHIPKPDNSDPREGLAPPPALQSHRDPDVPLEKNDGVDREITELEREIQKRVRVYGKYHASFGYGRHQDFTANNADADLQDRDDHYLFGERLNNTFDPAIYNQLEVNVDAEATDQLSFYSQVMIDPWSYTATSGDTIIASPVGDEFNVQFKYFGSNNSTIGEIYRAHLRNVAAFPAREAVNGRIPRVTTGAIADVGLTYDSGQDIELDYRFQPVRKLWADYDAEKWHVRVFALADQQQVMTTDDPLGLSNTKDYWQPSPWTARWIPMNMFADWGIPDVSGSIERGHYSDVLAFASRSSYGQYLTALRGFSAEYDLGRSYFGMMIAAPLTPWEDYSEVNNLPGVFRLKHQVTPQWMVGGLYGFRVGLIDKEPDAYNQVISLDTSYAMDPHTQVYAQVAGSRDEIDRLSTGNRHSPDGFISDVEGMAYKAGVKSDYDHKDGHSTFEADVVWMDTDFRPQLSNYRALRDDNFWGKHLSFHEYSPDLEYFRLGTGADIGRYVGHARVRTEMNNERFENLFDARHVRSSDKSSFIENVVRDEMTYKWSRNLRLKALSRWVLLPRTESDVEPFLGDFFFIDKFNLPEPDLQNNSIDAGLDPSRWEFAGGFQYDLTEQWMVEASYTYTNDIPDFPRGLQNNVFLLAPSRDPDTPNIELDRVQSFLYGQDAYGLPPYDFFSVVRERLIYKPNADMKWTFHAAQNSYKLWGPIDDMMNHQGLSLDYRLSEHVSLFMDYTHSLLADIPRFINTGFTEMNYRQHHNFFANLSWQLRPATRLNVSYGAFGEPLGEGSVLPTNPFSVSDFSMPTIDTEQLVRVSLEGDF